jgi:hypothetical protein
LVVCGDIEFRPRNFKQSSAMAATIQNERPDGEHAKDSPASFCCALTDSSTGFAGTDNNGLRISSKEEASRAFDPCDENDLMEPLPASLAAKPPKEGALHERRQRWRELSDQLF